jgi:hypothetical protein
MRSEEYEQRGVDRLIEKWGTKVIRPGGTSGGRYARGRNILNTVVKVPIAGV